LTLRTPVGTDPLPTSDNKIHSLRDSLPDSENQKQAADKTPTDERTPCGDGGATDALSDKQLDFVTELIDSDFEQTDNPEAIQKAVAKWSEMKLSEGAFRIGPPYKETAKYVLENVE